LGKARWRTLCDRGKIGQFDVVGKLCARAETPISIDESDIETARIAVGGETAALRRR